MEREELIKIVFEDSGTTKVVKGYLVSEDEFVYKIKTLDNKIIVVGKRAIIQINSVGGDRR